MYRVTTPTHTFTLPIETSTCSAVQVTYEQGKNELVKLYKNGELPSGMVLDGKNVIIVLTQEETKQFKVGKVSVQLRVLTTSNEAFASKMFKIPVTDVLNEEILEGQVPE